MIQDSSSPDDYFENFLQEVRETREVWGLMAPDEGWAYWVSDEEEEKDILLFWSNRESAVEHQQEDWADHVPTAIPLDKFITGWLKGMHDDGVLVGPNWDADLNGDEITPHEVATRLLEEEADAQEELEEEE